MPNSPQIPSSDPPFQGQAGRARHAAAAVPVRPDQHAALQEAPRRRRRDRPGHGQSRPTRPRSSSSRSWPRPPATRDNHGYSKSNGIANLRREVAAKYLKQYGVRLDPESEVIVCLGSKEGFSHMCLALMGPGDTAIVPAPYFPDPRLRGGAGVGQRDRAGSRATARSSCRTSPTPASICIPKPKLLILNYPHNPSTAVRRAAVLRRGGEAGASGTASW